MGSQSHRSFATNTVGFCLLPSELIHHIILNLALSDIIRLKSVGKPIFSVIADQDFVRDYNIQSSSATWLFIYKKRWHRDAVLYGFVDSSDRWFKVLIAEMLKSVVPPGEDLYFLTASGNFFLFALNTSKEVISVNPMTKSIKKIPPSPLGPRGTSLWRRSGMKLISGPRHFRFLFAEMLEYSPTLFEYNSEFDSWRSVEAIENVGDVACCNETECSHVFLSVLNGRSESVLMAIGSQRNPPVVLRPRFDPGNEEGLSSVGFSWGHTIDRLHVYGDGNMIVVRSDNAYEGSKSVRMLRCVELWGLSANGWQWELLSNVPIGLLEQIKKPYGAMMGCLAKRNGMVRAVLMSNFEGVWDIIWLSYDTRKSHWTWIPLPDCKMKGSNMAGITFSSGLTLS